MDLKPKTSHELFIHKANRPLRPSVVSENVDTSTPTGKMIFTVLGAVAELERSLIVERVKAGIRNARAKGKKLGRPRADVRQSEIEGLRASGASWRAIAKAMGVGVGTVHRIGQQRSKNACGAFSERQSGGLDDPKCDLYASYS